MRRNLFRLLPKFSKYKICKKFQEIGVKEKLQFLKDDDGS